MVKNAIIPLEPEEQMDVLMEIDNDILSTKYGVDISNYAHNVELLERIGKKRGCMIKGGEVDLERASKILLTDFRAGKLGKIALE